MPENSFTTWRYEQPYAADGPGTVTYTHAPDAFFRDPLDARRSSYFRTVDGGYPDGYLGTIKSRRDDRLLDSLKNRQNQRAYQRGVHKGERIDPGDYYWPEEFGPWDRITVQAKAEFDEDRRVWEHSRAELSGNGPVRLVNDGKTFYRGVPEAKVGTIEEMTAHRAASLAHLRPSWTL